MQSALPNIGRLNSIMVVHFTNLGIAKGIIECGNKRLIDDVEF